MHSFQAMNTTICTFGLRENARKQVEQWFAFVEKKLSRFRADSELSQLNRSNGRPFLPSNLLFQVMVAADFYYTETEGVFNPYLGHVLCELGYDKSFEIISAFSHNGLREKPRSKRNIATPVTIDPWMKSITLSPHVSVDLGGIAKGWSAQQMCNQLKRNGILSGAIDAGGDIVIWGEKEKGWEVYIADPFHPEKDLLFLKVEREAGIATSSTMKRRWRDGNGTVFHHIVDPRTGQCSESDIVQVTVLAPDLTTAEVYAKCLLILGWEEGMKWMKEKRTDLGVIGVRLDDSVVVGGRLQRYCSEGVYELERNLYSV
jgi:thiamine biosynthesis lipoprotein